MPLSFESWSPIRGNKIKCRWPGDQISWPGANRPVLTTSLKKRRIVFGLYYHSRCLVRQNCLLKREQGSDSNMADRLVFRPNYKINLDSFKEQEPQQAAKLYLTFGEGKGCMNTITTCPISPPYPRKVFQISRRRFHNVQCHLAKYWCQLNNPQNVNLHARNPCVCVFNLCNTQYFADLNV